MRHLAVLLALALALALASPPSGAEGPPTGAPARPTTIIDAPRLAPGVWPSNGDERVLLDLAVMPSEFLRRDLNNVLIPGGFRLSTWANLSSRSFAGDRARIVTSFRFDLDTAATPSEVDAFKPYLSPTRYSLLAAYVEAEVVDGLTLRAGRQFHADAADYLAFDGGKVLWTAGRLPLRLELYGGVRTTFAITTGAVASSLYELDGGQAQSGAQPLFGTVVRYLGDWRHRTEASVGFRWSWRTPGDLLKTDPNLPDSFSTTAQELTASAGGDLGPVQLSGGLGYELVLGALMRARATASVGLGTLLGWAVDEKRLQGSTFSLEYRRYRPTFALDSIFNWFSLNPYDEYSALVSAWVGSKVRAEARWFERRFDSDTTDRGGNTLTVAPGTVGAHGARLGAFAGFGGLLVDALAQLQLGYGGTRVLVDGGGRMALGDAFELYGRASVSSFTADTQPTQAGTSVGVVGGLTWRLPQGASVSLIVEETINPFTTRVPRFFGVADLARWL